MSQPIPVFITPKVLCTPFCGECLPNGESKRLANVPLLNLTDVWEEIVFGSMVALPDLFSAQDEVSTLFSLPCRASWL